MTTMREGVNALVKIGISQIKHTKADIIALAKEMEPLLDLPDEPTSAEYDLLNTGLKRVKKYRTGNENSRKEVQSPILDIGRNINAFVEELKVDILKIEAPLAKKKQAWDDAIEAERRKEEDRILALHEKLDLLSAIPVAVQDENLSDLRIRLRNLEANKITEEDYQEFKDDAVKLKIAGVTAIESAITTAEEKEQERLDLEFQKSEQAAAAKRLKEKEDALDRRQKELDEKEEALKPPEEKEPEMPAEKPIERRFKHTPDTNLPEACMEEFVDFLYTYLHANSDDLEIYVRITAAFRDTMKMEPPKAWRE